MSFSLRTRARLLGAACLPLLLAAAPASRAGTGSARAGSPERPVRYLLTARTAADLPAVRSEAEAAGARVLADVPDLAGTVIEASTQVRNALAGDPRVSGVGTDGVRRVATVDPGPARLSRPGLLGARAIPSLGGAQAGAARLADPAPTFRGLLWDYRRIGLPAAWRRTAGRPEVTVGVADTGLDSTHRELRGQVRQVVDFSAADRTCQAAQGTSDRDLARRYGGPADGDWNGHGTWIGGTVAGAVNGVGLNGIAPRVSLVALKISQFCGSTTDTAILRAIRYAGRHRLDVLNVSFGGFLDRRDPAGEDTYRAYVAAVAYARSRGTTVVASAGNEHVRVGAGGRVVSHGMITEPGKVPADAYGYYQVPGGVPGVVDVSATGNVVNAASARCPAGTTGGPADLNATCKPRSDRHQASGTGARDQLPYFSNYGPRVDLAAPGGARKFNLPYWDRGGTPGFPVTGADLTRAWENFGATSNWAVEVPCYTFAFGSGFPAGQCYTALQGTSMAAPHVAAAVALAASGTPAMRGRPAALIAAVTGTAVQRHNATRPLSATDRSPGDLLGVPCDLGYCHLGGRPISDADAYGAGVLLVPRR